MSIFREHLNESTMTYAQHLRHSVKQSIKLVIIALKSAVHGVFPNLFVNSGPLGIYHIYKEIRRFEHVRRALNKDNHFKKSENNL